MPNQKLHYFVEFESYKGLWRLKQNFQITDEEMEGLKDIYVSTVKVKVSVSQL